METYVLSFTFSAFTVIYHRDIPVKVIRCLTVFTALNGGPLQPTITRDLSVYPGRANYTQQSKWIRSLQVTDCVANPFNWCEIGDICEGNTDVVNGVVVQAYWSESDNACVVPGGTKTR